MSLADKPATVAEPADEAAQAATGLRATARWIAGAFAGIPSLAVVAALVRAPGDAGFDDGYLTAGVLLAAAGALVGILAFATVFAPVSLVDDSIASDVMKDLPEGRFATYDELRKALEVARDVVGEQRVLASDSAGWAEAAEAAAAQAEATVKLLAELLADEKPAYPVKQHEAVLARQEARGLRAAAGTAKGRGAMRAKELVLDEQILASLESLRRGAYGLQAGRTIGNAYKDTKKWSVLAVALVAAGVVFLALAPKPKAEPAKAALAPRLVTLTLTQAGQTALGCSAKTLDALKVGGDDKTPTVITLPVSGCPVRTVEFVTASPNPLGKFTKATVVKAK